MTVRARTLPSLCALAVFAAMAALYLFGARDLYSAILWRWGFTVWSFPFLDFQNSLAAWECTRMGLDVTVSNPCDALGRVHNYGPIWMAFSFVPLGTGDLWWTGLLIGAAFLGSFAFLPAVNRWQEVVVMTGATLSTAVVFTVERANVDALLFMLALAVGHLVARAPAAAYSLITIGAMYKYYPIMMLALAVRERRSLAIVGTAIAALGLYAAIYADQLGRAFKAIPDGFYFTGFFSARNLPMGSQLLWGVPAELVFAVLLSAFLITVMATIRSRASDQGALPEQHQTFLIIGSLLMVGCFFIGQSVFYRTIMFLFALPGLLVMARHSTLIRVVIGAILLLMWEGFFRHIWHMWSVDAGNRVIDAPPPLWMAREMLSWFVISALFAILVEFAAKSPAFKWLQRTTYLHRRT